LFAGYDLLNESQVFICINIISFYNNQDSIVTVKQLNQKSCNSFTIWGRGEIWFVKYFVAVLFGFAYLDCDICVPFIHQYSIFFSLRKLYMGNMFACFAYITLMNL
jgi:hypothetical protein